MEEELAWHVITSAFCSTDPLRELLPLLKEHCTDAECDEYGKAIARAIHSVQAELIDRVIAARLDIEQQIEAKIQKYGCVL